MKKIIYTLSIILGLGLSANAQVEKKTGPKFGITVLTPGLLADIVNGDRDLGDESIVNYSQDQAMMTQLGWQWETIIAEGDDFVGLVEWIGLIGGIEKGTFVPSVSALMGIRKGSGLEAAVGPTFSLTGAGMVFAVGHTFKSGDLNIPINIAWVPSRTSHFLGDPSDGNKMDSGHGVSIMIGFNFE